MKYFYIHEYFVLFAVDFQPVSSSRVLIIRYNDEIAEIINHG